MVSVHKFLYASFFAIMFYPYFFVLVAYLKKHKIYHCLTGVGLPSGDEEPLTPEKFQVTVTINLSLEGSIWDAD